MSIRFLADPNSQAESKRACQWTLLGILLLALVLLSDSALAQEKSEADSFETNKKIGRTDETLGMWMSRLKREQTVHELELARKIFEEQYGVSTKAVEINRKTSVVDSSTHEWTTKLMPSKELDVVSVAPGSRGYFSFFSKGDHLTELVQCASGDLLVLGTRIGARHPLLMKGSEKIVPSFQTILPIDPQRKSCFSRDARMHLLLDTSSDMKIADCPNGKSRFRYCAEQISALIRQKHENTVCWSRMTNPGQTAALITLFDPKGTNVLEENPLDTNDTSVRQAVRCAIGSYLHKRDHGDLSPHCVVVLSSFAPRSSEDNFESIQKDIQDATKLINSKDKFSLIFVQVGESDATENRLRRFFTNSGIHAGIVASKSFAEFKELGLEKIVAEFVKLGSKDDRQCENLGAELVIKAKKELPSGAR